MFSYLCFQDGICNGYDTALGGLIRIFTKTGSLAETKIWESQKHFHVMNKDSTLLWAYVTVGSQI